MEVKGTAVATIPLFVKDKHGDHGYQKWLDALTPESRLILDGSILPSSWYPMRETLVVPTKAICDLFYGGAMRGAVEQGRYSASKGLRGVYKLFIRVASPEFIIARASQILPTYYKPSSMMVAEKGPGFAAVRVTEFPEPDSIVEHRIMGWILQALDICGVENGQARIAESLTKGAQYTEFRVSWK